VAKDGRPLAPKGWRTCGSGVRQKGAFSGSWGRADGGCMREGQGRGDGEGWNGWGVEGEGWNVEGGCYAVDVEE
jgi:hypothetical protein